MLTGDRVRVHSAIDAGRGNGKTDDISSAPVLVDFYTCMVMDSDCSNISRRTT